MIDDINTWYQDPSLHYLLAQTYSYRQMPYEAIASYTNTILLAPLKYPKAYIHRAENYYATGNYVAAIKDASACEKLLPRYDKVYWLRGRSYVKLGMTNKAMQEFSALVAISPKSQNAIKKFLAEANRKP
jgi:tetratricopeptide (TPR) repeat protein